MYKTQQKTKTKVTLKADTCEAFLLQYTTSRAHPWWYVLAATVRQIVQEVTPVVSFFSQFSVLSSLKSHYLLTYNQHFVEIIKVSTDSYSYISWNPKFVLWTTREVQSLVDACHKDCDKFCLHKTFLWSTHSFLHRFLCICQYPMYVRTISTPVQDAYACVLLLLLKAAQCPSSFSFFGASSTPRSPKLLLISCRQ